MAAFNAVRRNETVKAFFDRLIAAAMKKLIAVLNVRIKTKSYRKENTTTNKNEKAGT
jgi:hypothetical protein